MDPPATKALAAPGMRPMMGTPSGGQGRMQQAASGSFPCVSEGAMPVRLRMAASTRLCTCVRACVVCVSVYSPHSETTEKA